MYKPKIADRWSNDIIEQDYSRNLNLRDTRVWFSIISRMTIRIQTTRSSVFAETLDRSCEGLSRNTVVLGT